MERAVKQAIDVCIQKDILKDILIASKSEVLHMLLEEYDEKLHLADTFAEGVEHGLERGLMQGKRQAVLELLEEYGEVPMDLELMILGESSDEVLKYWHKLAAKAASIEEFRQKMYP